MLHSHPSALDANTEHHGSVSYNGIDLVKFICALFVCTIHLVPFRGDASGILRYLNFGIQQYVARLGVPFFFVCSGFFLFRKLNGKDNKREIVRDYSLKLIRLMGLWTILLTATLSFHLWYLGATILAVVILCLLLKLNLRHRYLILIAGGLYVIGLLGESYYGLVEKLLRFPPLKYLDTAYFYFFTTTRNGLFMGLPFVLIGMLFADGKINIKLPVTVVGFFVSMLLLLGEVFVLKHYDIPKNYNMYVFLIPVTVFLFAFASQLRLKDRPIYKTLRTAGVLIYFSHLLVYKLVYFGVAAINKLLHIDLSALQFGFALICTVGVAFLIEYLSHKKNLKWLRWLYC